MALTGAESAQTTKLSEQSRRAQGVLFEAAKQVGAQETQAFGHKGLYHCCQTMEIHLSCYC